MPQFNFSKICQKVLNPLTQRQQEVMGRRFGLGDSRQRETLEAIGRDFGVTRERIRQIENDGFFKLEEQKAEGDVKRVFSHFKEHLKNQGGLKREDILLANLGGERSQNQVHFLLNLGDAFFRYSETEDFYPFWTIDQDLPERVGVILTKLFKKIEQISIPLSEEKLLRSFDSPKESLQFALSSLEIAKKIEKGPMGDFGLTIWPEIKPRGVKDRAYLVLKKTGKPLHFREIAEDSGELGGKFFPKSQVLPQTVHNELIRDERFILVGRGIYALREWGYEIGTVKDVISKVLGEKAKPLSREEILKEVLKQRLVKENTILLNLSDRDYFQKDSQGRYILKNA